MYQGIDLQGVPLYLAILKWLQSRDSIFGLFHISDVVNGALNKLKTNRTPTNSPQSDRYGRYRGLPGLVVFPARSTLA